MDRYKRTVLDPDAEDIFDITIAFACNSWLKKRSQNPNYEGELRLTNDSNAGFATPVETVKAICKENGWKIALKQLKMKGFTEVSTTKIFLL